MLAQPPLWLILVAFVCALGPLVFFHELGHYLVARWFGIPAEAFSIGFGREIVGWTDRRGTRWKVGWLPIGGYVRFVGDMSPASNPAELDSIAPELRDRVFQVRPVWQRFLVVLAGPAANFLLAIAIFSAFFALLGLPSTPTVVESVRPGSAAASIGLTKGDRIVEISGERVARFEDLQRIVVMRPGETVKVVIERSGERVARAVRLDVSEEQDRFGQKYRVGMLGVLGGKSAVEPIPVWRVVPEAVRYTVKLTGSMIEGLGQVISGRRGTEDVGGPIKIAQIAGQQASLGVLPFAQLLALFSINLGFINLLPVPMLDGGHLIFYAVEAVRRRPISARALDWAFRGGLAVILALVLFTTVNDLGSVGLWDRLQRLIG
jgi:regulator of sigma E protease